MQPAALKKNFLESLVAGRFDVPLGIRESDQLSGGLLRGVRLAEAFWRARTMV